MSKNCNEQQLQTPSNLVEVLSSTQSGNTNQPIPIAFLVILLLWVTNNFCSFHPLISMLSQTVQLDVGQPVGCSKHELCYT